MEKFDQHPVRVLIVDDEEPLRTRLQMLDWQFLGATVVGEAADGEEALDQCHKLNPDIVLVDITMPIMNGIQLLHQLKIQLPHIQVILLTCHNEFAYAQEAIRLGAVDYLLKASLTPNELKASLQKAKNVIKQNNSLKEQLEQEDRNRKAQQFRSMLSDDEGQINDHLQQLLSADDKMTFPIRFTRMIVQCHRDDEIFIDYEIQKILTAAMKQEPRMVWFPLQIGDYFVFIPDLAADPLSKKIEGMVSEANETIQAKLHFISNDYFIFASISDEIQDPKHFKAAFRESFYWTNYIFYENNHGVKLGTPPAYNQADKRLEDQFREFAIERTKSKDELAAFLRQDFIEWCKQQQIYPEDAKRLIEKFVLDWFMQRGQTNPQFEVALTASIAKAISIHDLMHSIIHIVQEQEQSQLGIRIEIKSALQYINERLHEPLTLAQVASEVGLSTDYLGKLFYEQVGESFKQYVTRIRMQKAMELLTTTNLKVYVIAEQVGIPNYRYFSVLFRKTTGFSPSQVKQGVIS